MACFKLHVHAVLLLAGDRMYAVCTQLDLSCSFAAPAAAVLLMRMLPGSMLQ
jgi:hypothetical protein